MESIPNMFKAHLASFKAVQICSSHIQTSFRPSEIYWLLFNFIDIRIMLLVEWQRQIIFPVFWHSNKSILAGARPTKLMIEFRMSLCCSLSAVYIENYIHALSRPSSFDLRIFLIYLFHETLGGLHMQRFNGADKNKLHKLTLTGVKILTMHTQIYTESQVI